MVAPPYLFQTDSVFMTFEYREGEDLFGTPTFSIRLLRDFAEGGAEYLRIINHSESKSVEFFLIDTDANTTDIIAYSDVPIIQFNRAPVYFLLHPERKPSKNAKDFFGNVIYFEGDRIGDLIVTVDQPWTIGMVAELYRDEFNRDNDRRLMIQCSRMIDHVQGRVRYTRVFYRRNFYGVLRPGEELLGNENFWLLATPNMFPQGNGFVLRGRLE
jgi:hypothetical protein